MSRRLKDNHSPNVDMDNSGFDPLAEAIKPPNNESESEKTKRLREEADAIKLSKEIDAKIAEENRLQDWRKKALKVLLLGQAESGKSTVLKSMSTCSYEQRTHIRLDFQLLYSPKWFQSEREAWRAIIQLNLIK